MTFAQTRKEWTIEDWQKVMWSDESPFQMFHIPNRQNDRVWARKSDEVEPCVQVKFPAKIHVWGMMSHQALSQLHIVPQKQTITGAYYRDNILENACIEALNRKAETGSVLVRAMHQT